MVRIFRPGRTLVCLPLERAFAPVRQARSYTEMFLLSLNALESYRPFGE